MSPRSQILLASAGSGKTFRLTSHYLQLVAQGVPPERILASTFTRKAAGEILGRIFSRLAAAAADDGAAERLERALETRLGRSDALALLARLARSIHRFRVRTLDAFFVEVSQAVSADIGLPPDWRIGDEVDAARARDDAIAAALEGSERDEWVVLLRELERGHSGRSVHATLEHAITAGHALFLESAASAWDTPAPIAAPDGAQLEAAQVALHALEPPLTKVGKPVKRWVESMDHAKACAEAGDWTGLVAKGVAKALIERKDTYEKHEIGHDVRAVFDVFLRQAASVRGAELRAQNTASRRLLEAYDARLREVQRVTRKLSFDDIARALGGEEGRPRDLALDLALRLDAAVDHLLLDEFQDTSPSQWRVLRSIASELAADGLGERSFFCVGDVKQSIYGWRSAEPRLLESLSAWLHLEPEHLDQSWRSSPIVLNAVNRVFSSIASFPGWKAEQGDVATAEAFQARFHEHRSARPELAGSVRVRTCAAAADDAGRWRACIESAVQCVQEIRAEAPSATVAVLLRRNRLAPRILARLRELRVAASDEGGNPLTDAIGVQAALAALHWLEHPGDTIARFHVASSVFGAALGLEPGMGVEAAASAHSRARRELGDLGVAEWLAALRAAACDRLPPWEQRRFSQLIDFALASAEGSRLADFLERVRRVRVEDSSSAKVKVMTIHASKGLEFDAVVLPELEHGWGGRGDTFVARREDDDPEKPIVTASRSGDASLRALLELAGDGRLAEAHAIARRKAIRDDLSSLYVAMTRARHRLDLVLWDEGGAKEEPRLNAAGAVRHAFGLGFGDLAADGVLFESEGASSDWGAAREPQTPSTTPGESSARLVFAPSRRARELERIRPSTVDDGLGGAGGLRSEELFAPRPERGRMRGNRWHAWFEQLEWLEDFNADDALLRSVAMRNGYGGERLEEDLSEFRAALLRPNVRRLLSRASHAAEVRGPQELEVWRERRFRLVVDGKFVSGAFDRVVVEQSGEGPTAAQIIDFKTDRDAAGAMARAERYRPQLDAYRTALARILRLPPERISARLAFVADDTIVEV